MQQWRSDRDSELAHCDTRPVAEQRQEGVARDAEPQDLACKATSRETIERFRPEPKGDSGIGRDGDLEPADGTHGSPLTTFIECGGRPRDRRRAGTPHSGGNRTKDDVPERPVSPLTKWRPPCMWRE